MGRVIRPHGIDGELRVYVFEPGAPNLQRGRSVTIAGEIRKIIRLREDRGDLLIGFEGITDRDAAMTLRGEILELPDRLVRRNDEDSYFLHELVGLLVETEGGEAVGNIREILQPGANDVYVVDTPSGEVLIPAIADVVRSIDLQARKIVIVPLAGMLDMSK